MVGDAVKLAGDARAATGAPTVTRCGATDVPVGIVVGIAFTGVGDVTNMPPVSNLNTPVYRAASTDRYLLVSDDPSVIYEVQYAGTSVAAATITANVGLNGQFTTTAGSTTTGLSQCMISTSLVGSSAVGDMRIIGLTPAVDNDWGDAYTVVQVQVSRSQFVATINAI